MPLYLPFGLVVRTARLSRCHCRVCHQRHRRRRRRDAIPGIVIRCGVFGKSIVAAAAAAAAAARIECLLPRVHHAIIPVPSSILREILHPFQSSASRLLSNLFPFYTTIVAMVFIAVVVISLLFVVVVVIVVPLDVSTPTATTTNTTTTTRVV